VVEAMRILEGCVTNLQHGSLPRQRVCRELVWKPRQESFSRANSPTNLG
jgi:hypothetical protein